MAALSPCSRSCHLAVSIVTLLSAPSPCCRLSHSLAVGLVALQSVSSSCCQPPRLAVGRLEICLTALQSAPSPCSRPRHLAVGPITLQLLILSLITRHIKPLTEEMDRTVSWPLLPDELTITALFTTRQWAMSFRQGHVML